MKLYGQLIIQMRGDGSALVLDSNFPSWIELKRDEGQNCWASTTKGFSSRNWGTYPKESENDSLEEEAEVNMRKLKQKLNKKRSYESPIKSNEAFIITSSWFFFFLSSPKSRSRLICSFCFPGFVVIKNKEILSDCFRSWHFCIILWAMICVFEAGFGRPCINIGKAVFRILITDSHAIWWRNLTCLNSLHFNIEFWFFRILSSVSFHHFQMKKKQKLHHYKQN